MAHKNTVNFLQIENGLDDAIALCEKEESSPWVAKYQTTLLEARRYLHEATGTADRTFLAWRAEMKARLLASKHLWQRFEEARDEMGEFGIDAEPSHQVGYWEAEEIKSAAEQLVRFLDSVKDLPEADEAAADLRGKIATLTTALREENHALEDYKRLAPIRRQAIYRAMNAVESFKAVRRDYLR